mmetsp:Transcript_13049/g.20252  ORF Transcript_13049/g.20252 Transcript_13049/m.20252 type:complete len:140 (+) Transcript_13049:206-625(+)|eukprot:CAMPEP_0170494704 /NCGR_PEP_ID=MMETSP0208-20121228/14791_1 /TAXON_ID=197538 /ORGANISM="Strombidium inclinatum, Strain S3" /LENGTH=139 /DNA_ID=CAMNT_0010770791 /DNA_START=196 /DNA_END=615 /DNA_ORIENTATION=+
MIALPKQNEMKQMAALHIWDTLGQEKFHSIAKLFFKGSVGAFLVFDLSSRESFEAIKKTWYNLLKESCETRLVITLLGNKSDLQSREVFYNEAMDFAREKGMNYLEVSAKSGRNVRSAFSLMVNQIFIHHREALMQVNM